MRPLVGTLLATVALLAACGAADEEPLDAVTETTPARELETMPATDAPTQAAETPAPSTEPDSETPAPEPDGTVITTGDSAFGEMLFDDGEQAIYMFDVERTATPECYDDCVEAWPPVLTDGAPQAGGNLDPALLSTTERSDGTVQVTYNGHPLYYYAHEEPGEVKCHNVNLNGGLWYVVQPDGNPAPPV
jgi:predicted lipoprotein with Yx(FWY)xxD motif